MKILNIIKISLILVIFPVFGLGQENTASAKNQQVLLNVTVVNEYSEPVNNLKAENFRLFEDKKLAKISHFKAENAPISVGFLIDTSPSMGQYSDQSREGIMTFLEKSNPQNEYFVTAFNKKVEPVSEFVGVEEMKKIISNDPHFTNFPKGGDSALHKAIISGIDKLAQAKNQKKVLFIFWDAAEDYSAGTYKEIEKLLKEKNIALYLVSYGGNDDVLGDPLGMLAKRSGGSAYYSPGIGKMKVIQYRSILHSAHDLFMIRFSNLAAQLQNQYVIGFNCAPDDSKNKWRKIEIKFDDGNKEPKKEDVFIYHRAGYYPTSEIVVNN